MKIEELIYKRKSHRKYSDKELSEEILNKIIEYSKTLKSLDNKIKTDIKIVSKKEVTTILPWKSPYYIEIFSEEKDNHLMNVGFKYQQLDLYIQSLGLGSCWIGMGKPSNNKKYNNMKFIIMFSLGYSEEEKKYREKFKRKDILEISDIEDKALEGARHAPSAVNGQPWYFVHEDNKIHVYREKQNTLKNVMYGYMNKIDIGIALSHIYLENKSTFKYLGEINHPEKDGYIYMCTIKVGE